MITLIHGEDTASSRNYFQELKKKEKEVLSFDGEKITLTDLVQNIEGTSLFEDTKTIFIENFLTKLKKNKESKEILNFLIKKSKDSNFVLWESKEIPKKNLFSFKSAVIKNFKLPQNIFLFLDSLKPKSYKETLSFFHKAIESGIKEELILFMLQRQFRLLLALCHPDPESSEGEGSQIDEINRLAPWQMGKLDRQAKLFSEEELKKIYKKLYEIEIAQKTGKLNLSLSQSIDFLLMDM